MGWGEEEAEEEEETREGPGEGGERAIDKREVGDLLARHRAAAGSRTRARGNDSWSTNTRAYVPSLRPSSSSSSLRGHGRVLARVRIVGEVTRITEEPVTRARASTGGNGDGPRILLSVPRAPALMRPLKHLKVAFIRRPMARRLVPRAPVLTRPLQDIQVPSVRRISARLRVPRAPVLTQPLQHLQVPFVRRPPARALVPRAPVPTRQLEHLQVACPRRPLACARAPRATVLTCPLQDIKVPSRRRTQARLFHVPRAPVRV